MLLPPFTPSQRQHDAEIMHPMPTIECRLTCLSLTLPSSLLRQRQANQLPT